MNETTEQSPTRKRGGHPALPAGEQRTLRLEVQVNAAERAAIVAAAAAYGDPPRVWLRKLALAAAARAGYVPTAPPAAE